MSGKIREAVARLTEDIARNPQGAHTVFRVSTSATEGDRLMTKSEIRSFGVSMDEPRDLGGDDTAPNPVEMVLAALGSCQAIVYRAFAVALGMDIRKIEVHAKGHLDLRGFLNMADVPAGFSNVTFTTRVVSPEPPERIRQLAGLVEKHCPVMDTLQRPVAVRGKVELRSPHAPPGRSTEVVYETPLEAAGSQP